jgi:hypothetical protein
MDGAPHNFQLLEPSSPEALVPDSRVETWMIVVPVAVVFILALVTFLILRKKKSAPVDASVARNAARAEAIAALDAIPTSCSTREVAVRCSLIIRKYLSIAAADPALFETHEEYLSRHEALKNFTPEARSTAQQGFTRLAGWKYAETAPDVAFDVLIAGSRKLLETLHQGFMA